jgi:hypothetical protein
MLGARISSLLNLLPRADLGAEHEISSGHVHPAPLTSDNSRISSTSKHPVQLEVDSEAREGSLTFHSTRQIIISAATRRWRTATEEVEHYLT